MDWFLNLPLNPAVAAWLGVLGAILGIAGISYAVISNRRNRKEKEPYWTSQSYPLVTRSRVNVPDLEVAFRGRRVSTLTITELLFWNHGRETIDGGDVAGANPLRIVPHPDTEILAATVIAANSRSQPTVTLTPDGAMLGFDFLDQGQGFVLRVVHTGAWGHEPRLQGDIRGSRPLEQVSRYYGDLVQPPREPVSRKDRYLAFGRSNWFILVVYVGVPAAMIIWAFFDPRARAYAVFAGIMLAMLAALFAFIAFTSRSRKPPQPVGFLPVEEPVLKDEPASVPGSGPVAKLADPPNPRSRAKSRQPTQQSR